jgi:hypothetical protein
MEAISGKTSTAQTLNIQRKFKHQIGAIQLGAWIFEAFPEC